MGNGDLPSRLRQAALTAGGDTDRPLRVAVQRAVAGLVRGSRDDLRALDEGVRSYVEAVALRAPTIDDAQVDRLRTAGLSERAIFELTINAAVAAGLERLAVAREVRDACD